MLAAKTIVATAETVSVAHFQNCHHGGGSGALSGAAVGGGGTWPSITVRSDTETCGGCGCGVSIFLTRLLSCPHRLVPGHHHVDIAAAALRANKPAAPFRHWHLWPIPVCLLGRVRFAPVTTCFAPDLKPELGRGGAFEGHRRAAVGLHGLGYGSSLRLRSAPLPAEGPGGGAGGVLAAGAVGDRGKSIPRRVSSSRRMLLCKAVLAMKHAFLLLQYPVYKLAKDPPMISVDLV